MKSLRLISYGQVGWMQNQRMPKEIATVTIEGAKKGGRQRKSWRDEFEEDLHIKETKRQAGNG